MKNMRKIVAVPVVALALVGGAVTVAPPADSAADWTIAVPMPRKEAKTKCVSAKKVQSIALGASKSKVKKVLGSPGNLYTLRIIYGVDGYTLLETRRWPICKKAPKVGVITYRANKVGGVGVGQP